ncbi:cell division protein FtsQ/DivIB [Solitalea koreensis]|uniref:Cell division protein FtsQ n=1 Tax=Solitalea koreensis TaxID=543615 RepID=A0A521E5I6_9SPHI|nr:cell division protein FtsQ [Solitalea koreensis]SMO78631.1 cell division protein FtsQ [Solitalea koreensis]
MNFLKRINWKRILIVATWATCLLGVIVLLSFVSAKQEKVRCKGVKISIDGKRNFLVEKGEVLAIMNRILPKFVSKPINDIPVEQIETALERNPYIQRADIFIDLDGIVNVKVVQREPILRIINAANQSFYVDKNGFKMPLSPNFSPRVLVANGNITEMPSLNDTLKTNVAKELFVLTQFVEDNKDEFWKSQIAEMYVNDAHEIVLIPRVGDSKIVLGNVDDLESRLNNLLTFYKKALPRMGWDTYKIINIKYANQIIGVRDTTIQQTNTVITSSIQ